MLYGSGLDDLHVLGEGGGRIVACCRSWHRGVTRMPDKGGAEGVADLAHEGRTRCSCFLLRVDGRGHLSRPQRPAQVDREDRAQVRCGRGVRTDRGAGSPPPVAGHPGGTSMLLTTPWCPATVAGPAARSSRERVPGAGCQPCRRRWSSWGLEAAKEAGGWGHPEGPCHWGAWS